MIELTDTTILISFRIDSLERLDNLKTTHKYLTQNFKVPLLYVECDKQPYKDKYDWATLTENIDYEFVQDFCEVFHRTKITNYALKKIKTPIVVNWDLDCIVPPENVAMAVDIAKMGLAQVNPFSEYECFCAIQ